MVDNQGVKVQSGTAATLPGGAISVIHSPKGDVDPGTARARQVPIHGDVAGYDENSF